jgi:hypothetical protein
MDPDQDRVGLTVDGSLASVSGGAASSPGAWRHHVRKAVDCGRLGSIGQGLGGIKGE